MTTIIDKNSFVKLMNFTCFEKQLDGVVGVIAKFVLSLNDYRRFIFNSVNFGAESDNRVNQDY